ILALAFTGLSCTQKPKTPRERGAGVFNRACASCHAVSAGQRARPGFKVQPPNLADPVLQARLSDADIERVIRTGKGEMPPFGRMLSQDEVDMLLVYLRSLPVTRRQAP